MKIIITFFILLSFFGIPVSAKAQSGISKSTGIANHEKLLALNFIETISFISSLTSRPTVKVEPNIVNDDKKPIDMKSTNNIEKLSSPQVKYAMMMDVNLESVTDALLYDFVEKWYGTRYRMGGTTKNGIDCSAFTESLLSVVYNLAVPRTAKEQYKTCLHINKNDLTEGDLVFFNTRGGISHVGVYLANGYFVHSSASQGVMISHLSDSYFARRFIGGGRVNNSVDCVPAN